MCHRHPTVAALWALSFLSFATAPVHAQTTDVLGDPLPKGALARAGTVRWRHGSVVMFAAFLSDGKSVLSVDEDRLIRVWEYPSGKELRGFDQVPPTNPTGLLPPRRVRGNNGTVALSRDGKTLACNFGDAAIQVYDVATGKILRSVSVGGNGRGFGGAIDFSPDGKHLALFNFDGGVQIWDWDKDREVRQFGKKTQVRVGLGFNPPVAFAPNGKLLVSFHLDIENNMVVSRLKLWDPSTGAEVRDIPLANNASIVSAVAFSPDSATLAFIDTDGTTKLIDTAVGGVARTLNGPKLQGGGRGGSVLAFSPDGKSLFQSGGIAPGVREWNTTTGAEVRPSVPDMAERRAPLTLFPAYSMTVGQGGKTLVLAGQDQLVHFVDAATGKELPLAAATGHLAPVDFVQFSPDGRHLWTQQGFGTAIHRWETASGKDAGDLQAATGGFFKPTVSADGRVMAIPSANRAGFRLLDMVSGTLGAIIVAKMDRETPETALSPDGKVLALRSRSEKTIELVDTKTGRRLGAIAIETGERQRDRVNPQPPATVLPSTMLFSSDGKTLAAYGEPGKLALWDAATGKRQKFVALPESLAGIVPAAFSPDGRCLAFDLRDGTVALCELATGTIRRVFGKAQPRPVAMLLPSMARVGEIPEIGKVAFSPDGTKLVLGGVDRALHVWDVTTGRELASFAGHIGSIGAVAFAADGQRVATGSHDTTALIWDLSKTKAPARVAKILSGADLESCWEALLHPDAARAFAAVCDLAASPKEAVALLARRLHPAPPLDGGRVQELLALLDSDKYKERQQASADLIKMGERVVPALYGALALKPNLEMQRRLETLVDKLAGPKWTGEQLRAVRAVEVLERIGSPEARRHLDCLADGAPGALMTQSSEAALRRLGH